MRTFIAIDLDEKIKKNVESLIGELKPLAENVRWVSPPGMHLTLKFLGEIGTEDESRIPGILESLVKRHKPFGLTLRGTGVFPPGRKNPRVLWVGVVDEPALAALQEDVASEMEKIGFEKEKRKFHPHLTLGRVRIPCRLEGLLQELETKREQPFGEMKVRKVTFFQSILRPTGAEYRVLKEALLG